MSTLISKHGYPCKDIPQWISVNNKYPYMDIHVLWISVFNYPCFYEYPFGYPWISMNIHLDILGFLWISMHWLAMDSRSRVLWFQDWWLLQMRYSECRAARTCPITSVFESERRGSSYWNKIKSRHEVCDPETLRSLVALFEKSVRAPHSQGRVIWPVNGKSRNVHFNANLKVGFSTFQFFTPRRTLKGAAFPEHAASDTDRPWNGHNWGTADWPGYPQWLNLLQGICDNKTYLTTKKTQHPHIE